MDSNGSVPTLLSAVTVRARHPEQWPVSVYVALGAMIIYAVASSVSRPPFPKLAPKLVDESWPIIGSWAFWTERTNFWRRHLSKTSIGHFSFYFGPHQLVCLSGTEGRKFFFESKHLSMTEGYQTFLTSQPEAKRDKNNEDEPFHKFFARNLVPLMKREVLAANLRKLTSDTRTSLEGLMGPSHDPSLPPGVMKPFDTIYEIVFQLTMRTVGAHEISTNPALLKKMLGLFETIERAGSATKIIFPWAPSLGHLRRIMAGAQVYMMLGNIVKSRREKGVRYEDAMQVLVDSSSSVMDITTFVVGSLYAGQLNSGINAAWLLIELAQHREWYAQVQAEVDAAVKKHRTSEKQSAVDVLDTLDMDAWESEFPLIDLCLRECIRFQLTGSAFRKNISGQDIPIGNGEIVPRDAYAVYYIDDVHFNPSIYSDPYKWDPSRYLPDRAEDKKSPMAYAGWGLGRHPCLGMRFAKLEMAIITSYFAAMYDWELCDKSGNPVKQGPPHPDRNKHSAKKPPTPAYVRYWPR